MAKVEIKKIFWVIPGCHVPCSLSIIEQLWWRFMPGVVINVRWPSGDITITEDHPQWDWTIGPSKYIVYSADPNEHYRPWLEENVGKQGWDWNWGMAARDALDDRLTIKIRRRHKKYATMLALRWG